MTEAIPMGSESLTQFLIHASSGSAESLRQLLTVVYQDLRRIAGAHMRRESPQHTLQPTALVHEAYLRLIGQHSVQWQNRSHFFGIASQLMRRILLDHARAAHAEKRGGGLVKVQFDDALGVADRGPDIDVMLLDGALRRLSEFDERQGKIAELRYFGGLSIEETALALEISPATVKREWRMAKSWLFRELENVANLDA